MVFFSRGDPFILLCYAFSALFNFLLAFVIVFIDPYGWYELETSERVSSLVSCLVCVVMEGLLVSIAQSNSDVC